MNVFNFDPFTSPDFTIPGILGVIGSLLGKIFDLLGDLMQGLKSMLTGIHNISEIIDNMITAIKMDNIQGLPILESIGVYRYLVGDIVFNLTYTMLLFGIMFTIYKLVLLIKKVWSEFMSLGSGGGLLNKISKFLG